MDVLSIIHIVLAGGFTRFGGPQRPHKSGTSIGMAKMAEGELGWLGLPFSMVLAGLTIYLGPCFSSIWFLYPHGISSSRTHLPV